MSPEDPEAALPEAPPPEAAPPESAPPESAPPESAPAHTRSIALGLVALALVVRAVGAETWWLNPDEGIYFEILTAPSAADFWEGVRWNAHPPLYYLLLRGLGALTWDFAWYRAISIVAGCAAVLGLWLCGLELGGRGRRGVVAGVLAALLVAVSPWAIVASQVMRPYMLLLALLSFALYALLRWLRHGSTPLLIAYVVCLCLALLTHYSALLAAAVFGGLAGAELVRGRLPDGAARSLLAAHLAPAAIVIGLYVVHLRPLMSGTLAANALRGWLAPLMPGSPVELWTALVGFFAMVAGGWLAAPLSLLLVAALVWAGRTRSWPIVILAGGALSIAVVLAVVGRYPLGGSRHVTWLLPFVLLPVACFVAWGLDSGRRVARAFVPALAALVAIGGPLGRWMGTDTIVPPQEERVLRRDDLARVLAPLSTLEGVGPAVMNGQTYYLLLPLYEAERREAVASEDGAFFRFAWLDRDIVVSASWDLRVGIGELGAANHLYHLLERVDGEAPELALGEQRRALVIFGGWPPRASTGDIGALRGYESVVGGGWAVPGLEAFVADLAEYRRIIEASGRLPSLP